MKTEAELEGLLRKYQLTLNLPEWKIQLKVVSEKELAHLLRVADFTDLPKAFLRMQFDLKIAAIYLNEKAEEEENFVSWDFILVHELLHIYFRPLKYLERYILEQITDEKTSKVLDELFQNQVESTINRLAQVILKSFNGN